MRCCTSMRKFCTAICQLSERKTKTPAMSAPPPQQATKFTLYLAAIGPGLPPPTQEHQQVLQVLQMFAPQLQPWLTVYLVSREALAHVPPSVATQGLPAIVDNSSGQRAPPGRAGHVLSAVAQKAAEVAAAAASSASPYASAAASTMPQAPRPPTARANPLSDDFFQAETRIVPGTAATALTMGQRSIAGSGSAGFTGRGRFGTGHGMPVAEFSEKAVLPATADPFGPKFWQALAEDPTPPSTMGSTDPTINPALYGQAPPTYTPGTPGYYQAPSAGASAPGGHTQPPADTWRRERKLGEADAEAMEMQRKQRDEEIKARLQQGRGGASTGTGAHMPPGMGGGSGYPGSHPGGHPGGYTPPQELSIRQEREAAAGLMLTRPLGVAAPPPYPGMRF